MKWFFQHQWLKNVFFPQSWLKNIVIISPGIGIRIGWHQISGIGIGGNSGIDPSICTTQGNT